MTLASLTERQQQAVGARLLWKRVRTKSDRKFDHWLARICIRLQTYF